MLTMNSLVLRIGDFLSCRPQRVCVRDTVSEVLTVSTGCPQGRGLGPVLLSDFANEFRINEEKLQAN